MYRNTTTTYIQQPSERHRLEPHVYKGYPLNRKPHVYCIETHTRTNTQPLYMAPTTMGTDKTTVRPKQPLREHTQSLCIIETHQLRIFSYEMNDISQSPMFKRGPP